MHKLTTTYSVLVIRVMEKNETGRGDAGAWGVGQGVEGERKFHIGWQGWPLREAGGEKVILLRLCVLGGGCFPGRGSA